LAQQLQLQQQQSLASASVAAQIHHNKLQISTPMGFGQGRLAAEQSPPELISFGLDCVFSVLLELNRRDPELCAQSLQSLLQLLQHMEPESLSGQSKQMARRMHQLLRELRREGNASVSAGANACMMVGRLFWKLLN
jgi:hypothetical protein